MRKRGSCLAPSAVLSALGFCGAMLLALGVPAQAQQPAKVIRLGFLIGADATTEKDRIEAFRQGLRELGYVEGKNIVIQWRYGEGKFDRLPDLAAELVRLKVEVIVTGGPRSTRAAKQVTTKEIVPRLSRVAVLGTSTQPGIPQALRATELAAAAFGVQLQYLEVPGPKDIDTAFREASMGRADAVLVLASAVFNPLRAQLADLAVKSRLPAIYHNPQFVEDGGLMSYGVSFTDLSRRAATYVDKILKGAKPADLPVERPTKFELVINLKAAKQIGLTIPPSVLARADKVIR